MVTEILSRRGLALSLTAALLVAGCGRDELNAPPPVADTVAVVVPELELPASVIDAPVEYDLGPALAWLEEVVPRRLGNLEERHQATGNDRISYAFSASRSPFQLRLEGTTATLSAVVTYGGRGWYDPPLLPPISGSCGLDDTPPRFRVTVRTTVTLSADWALRARSRVVAVAPLTSEPRDQCVVTVARIDMTERVLGAVSGAIEAQLDQVDRQLANYDLRGRVAEVWEFLGTPMALQDSLWLVVDPAAIRLGRVTNEGSMLRTAVRLTAYPRVLGGPRPEVAMRPVPPLERGDADEGLAIQTQGRIPWDVLTGILRRELVGDTITVSGRELVIADVTTSGLPDGRVAVGLGLRGAARGTVYLVGRPDYDTRSAVLTMPDLSFDVQSRSLMVSGLAWLAGGQVEEYLRRELQVSLAGVLEDGLALLARELSRELAPGVRLDTDITGGQVFRVRPGAGALLVDAIASGRAELRLQLAPGRRVGEGR